MKKILLSITIFLLAIFPLSNVSAASHKEYAIVTTSYSSALNTYSFELKPGKNIYLKHTYFHQVVDGDRTYLGYCLEDYKGAPAKDGFVYDSGATIKYNDGDEIDEGKKTLLKNVLAAGLQYSGNVQNFVNTSSNATKKYYLATQIIVWEIVNDVRGDYDKYAKTAGVKAILKKDSELKGKYQTILTNAGKLANASAPAAANQTYILHWNDAKGKYTRNKINTGIFNIDTYDKKITISEKSTANNYAVSTASEFPTASTITYKYVLGNTIDSGEKFKWFAFRDANGNPSISLQKVLVAYYQGKATGKFFVKTESGKFRIRKKDATTDKNLNGAVFSIYKCSSSSKCDKKASHTINMKNTSLSDQIVLKKSGLYKFVETTVPTGYEKIPNFFVTFSINDSGVVSAKIDSAASSYVTKTDAKTGSVFNLIVHNDSKTFKIKKMDGDDNKTLIKGAGFQIFEKGSSKPLKFKQKTNTEGYYIYNTSGDITTLKADSKNTYTISTLPVGEYVLKEVSVPAPYVLPGDADERKTSFKIDAKNYLQVYNYNSKKYVTSSDVTITIKNFKSKIIFVKKGSDNTSLDDVQFELYKSDKTTKVPLTYASGKYTYDETNGNTNNLVSKNNGKIIIEQLPDGKYWLKEVALPAKWSDYKIPSNPWTDFDIKIHRGVSKVKSGSVTTNHAFGWTKDITNTKKADNFAKIFKKGAKKEAIAGVTFELYKSDKTTKVNFVKKSDGIYEYTENTGVTKLVTNGSGVIEMKKLKKQLYYLKEVALPAGSEYSLPNDVWTPIDLVKEKENSKTGGIEFTKELLNSKNEQKPTRLIVTKKGETNIQGGTDKPIEGVTFELHRSDNSLVRLTKKSNNGEYEYTNGTTGEVNLVTNKNGKISVDKLPNGDYYLYEKSLPQGSIYILPEKEEERKTYVTIDDHAPSLDSEQYIKIETTITNRNYRTKLLINKVNSKDKPIEGVTFELYDKNKANKINLIKVGNGNGSYVYKENDTPIPLITDSQGQLNITNLPSGDYQLKEVSVPTGYVMPDDPWTSIHIDSKTNHTNEYALFSRKVVNGETKKKVRVIIIKKGETTEGSEVLEGVTFKLWDESRQSEIPLTYSNGVYKYNVNGSATDLVTNAQGKIVVEELPTGLYYFEEVSIPDNLDYTMPIGEKKFTPVDVSIYEEKGSDPNYVEYVEEITNKKVTNGSFCFYKIDEDGNYLHSGKFQVQYYNEKTSRYDDVALIRNGDEFIVDETGKSDIYEFTPFESGETCFYGISRIGKYRIIEKESPDGYAVSSPEDSAVEVSLNSTGVFDGSALLMNRKIRIGEEAQAEAELIINIQTGQNRINYVAIISAILLLIGGLIFYKKKIDKK